MMLREITLRSCLVVRYPAMVLLSWEVEPNWFRLRQRLVILLTLKTMEHLKALSLEGYYISLIVMTSLTAMRKERQLSTLMMIQTVSTMKTQLG